MKDRLMADPALPTPRLSTLALSIPIAMGYVPLGVVFGFLLVQAGAAWWVPPLASLLVFAGAAQFMVIPMLAIEASLWTIVLATFIVNLRHIFYGLSLLHMLPTHPLARAYIIWTLTDENYSVITTLPADTNSAQLVGVAMLNHGWWVLGAFLGAAIGMRTPTAINGIEFSLAALFAVLTVEQWRATGRTTPIFVAILSYAAARMVAPSQALLVAIGLSVIVGALLSSNSSPESAR